MNKAFLLSSALVAVRAEASETPPDDLQEQLIRASARIVLAVVAVLLTAFFLMVPTKRSMAKKLITKERRSVVSYRAPASEGTVRRALEAAIHAPNHWVNEPWRFRLLGKQTVEKIIALNPGKKELFEQVPGWMMVSVLPTQLEGADKWNVKSLEDHAATACAVQNFMLSMASDGCATKWMTGAMGIPPSKLMELAGADEAKEHFMGIIFFGRPGTNPETMKVPKRKIGLDEPVLRQLP